MGAIRVAVLVGLVVGGCASRGPMRVEVRDGAGLPEQFESVWRGLMWGFSPADAAKIIDTQTPFQSEPWGGGVMIRSNLAEQMYGRQVEVRMFFPDSGLRWIDLEPKITKERYASLTSDACLSAWYDYYGGLVTKYGDGRCAIDDTHRACRWVPDRDLVIRLTLRVETAELEGHADCRLVIEYRDEPWLDGHRAKTHQTEAEKF